jgi:2,4-dienoyl-CoA reductase-like NADH-dependent reductase (Old Yellow Enzyme family)
MGADEFDLIAIGRALITDPLWAEKVREGRLDELLPFEKAQLAALG